MPSFQCRKLLTESEVFNQEAATCVEEAKNGAEQESKGLCHAGLLSRFACGTQRYILLKSQADRILANDSLDRIVAIKVLPAHLADRAELRERFEREARTVASLTTP
jgi:hypothetical protein